MTKPVLLAAAAATAGVLVVAAAKWMVAPSLHSFSFVVDLTNPNVATSTDLTLGSLDGPWPQWRGPNRDGVSTETGLLDLWPEHGPPLAWQTEGLGSGYSTVAIAAGKIFTMGQRDGSVYLVALDVSDGREIWSTRLGEGSAPNGTPTVDGDRVYAITYEGVLVSAQTADGSIVWRKSFVDDYQGHVPTWGYSESPLVDGDRLVATPGAEKALMVAWDKQTGEQIWASPLPQEMSGTGHGGAGYSSIVISHAAGARQYVQLFGNGVVGIATEHGKPLWGYTRIANDTANIPTPLVRDDYVFVSTGYGTGAALLRLVQTPQGVQANEVYFHGGSDMQNHHGGMVLLNDHVYFAHGHNQGFPICIELLSGRIVWGPDRGPGTGSAAMVCADGHLYFRYQNAVMALVKATPDGYTLQSSFRLPSNLGESWPHPVIANKRLYLRDQDVLLCYNIDGE